jgi:hypothetical protein
MDVPYSHKQGLDRDSKGQILLVGVVYGISDEMEVDVNNSAGCTVT